MNGEDKKFLDSRLTKLEVIVKERWTAHEKRSKELGEYLRSTLKDLGDSFDAVYARVTELPCGVCKSEINWMKWTIRGIIGVMMTVSILFIRAWLISAGQ